MVTIKHITFLVIMILKYGLVGDQMEAMFPKQMSLSQVHTHP
jgi:hypothetical protein